MLIRYTRAALLLALCSACSAPPEPITVNDGTVSVLNRTESAWHDVIVTVNDHFRGGTALLQPGGRLTAPLSQFQTAHGQKFSLARQSPYKIEVTATDATGRPVALAWGHTRP